MKKRTYSFYKLYLREHNDKQDSLHYLIKSWTTS